MNKTDNTIAVFSKDGKTLERCPNIEKFEIPEGVTTVMKDAFQDCPNLQEIYIPSSVTKIDSEAPDVYYDYWNIFSKCPALRKIVVSPENEVYDSRENCNAIVFSEIFYSEEEDDFSPALLLYACSSTKIPNGLIGIAEGAFEGCLSLKEVFIPEGVDVVQTPNFSSSVERIIVSDKNKHYDSRENCNAIIETTTDTLIVGCGTTIIPKTVKKIGCFAFKDCLSLESIVIPEGVEEIGDGAFAGCINLKSITLPRKMVVSKGEKDRFKAMGLDGDNIILIEE